MTAVVVAARGADGAILRFTLEGEHVRLEPLELAHIPGLVAAGSSNRDSYAYTAVPQDPVTMREYVGKALDLRAAGKAHPFATVDRRRRVVVGTTRFANLEFWEGPVGHPLQRGVDLPDGAEIGWTWLAAEAQRTAINTEAKLLMLRHAFEAWRVHRVCLNADARNQRSRTAIERLGAKFDGVIRAERMAIDGVIRDTACYSIVEAEWPAVRDGLEARWREPE